METPEHYYTDSIYWVEVERIRPNPFQPRKSFDELALESLSESIRQYGVLQPLVVTRKEIELPGEGMRVEYELVAGERRLRAAKMAAVAQVPVVIRSHEETDKMKLELAIIENLQREDLNPVDRAKAFLQLAEKFELKHTEIAKRVGKSREYVSNTLRILALPDHMLEALASGEISEGHTRPLLMLAERQEEQEVLFKEIKDKKMTVRETERIARRIAQERTRKKDLTPEWLSMERELTEGLGTRVTIEKTEKGGKIHIDFFNEEDLEALKQVILASQMEEESGEGEGKSAAQIEMESAVNAEETLREHTQAKEEKQKEENPEEDLYSIRNFTV